MIAYSLCGVVIYSIQIRVNSRTVKNTAARLKKKDTSKGIWRKDNDELESVRKQAACQVFNPAGDPCIIYVRTPKKGPFRHRPPPDYDPQNLDDYLSCDNEPISKHDVIISMSFLYNSFC